MKNFYQKKKGEGRLIMGRVLKKSKYKIKNVMREKISGAGLSPVIPIYKFEKHFKCSSTAFGDA